MKSFIKNLGVLATGFGLLFAVQFATGALSVTRGPAGVIFATGSTTCPLFSIAAEGSSLLRAGTYANLYAATSTKWGTADGTHFNAPDIRGYLMRGWDHGIGHENTTDRAARTAVHTGGSTGDDVGSFENNATALPNSSFTTGTESAGHTHNITQRDAGGVGNTFNAGSGGTPQNQSTGGESATHIHTVTGGGDLETRPMNVYVLYCVWY